MQASHGAIESPLSIIAVPGIGYKGDAIYEKFAGPAAEMRDRNGIDPLPGDWEFVKSSATAAAFFTYARLYAPGVLSEACRRAVMQMIGRLHPNPEAFLEPSRIEIREAGSWWGTYLMQADGTHRTLSLTRLLKHESPRTRFARALRCAVEDQINAFREQWLNSASSLPMCPYSGLLLNPLGADVDHVAPRTFSHLLNRFLHEAQITPKHLEEWNQRPITTHYTQHPTRDCCVLTDQALVQRFQQFHRKHARLQVLHPYINRVVMPALQGMQDQEAVYD